MRSLIKYGFIRIFLIIIGLHEIYGHGKLMDPVNRSSAWRKGFDTPPNWNDNANFCGGLQIKIQNGGKCGPCGDDYRDPQPRNNENGGYYGTGTIVKSYKIGEPITVTVDISANHLGHFEFAICPLDGSNNLETEECFAAHPVKLADGSSEYIVPPGKLGDHVIDVLLPEDLSCEHCSFRWHYRAANNWGVCVNGTEKLGCGPQEWFRSCSDITIQ